MLLATDDGEAEDLFVTHQSLIKSYLPAGLYTSISQSIESFEFEQGLKMLTPYIEKLAEETKPVDLTELLTLLNDNDGEASDKFEMLESDLRLVLNHEDFTLLSEAIEQFDFESATTLLSRYQPNSEAPN